MTEADDQLVTDFLRVVESKDGFVMEVGVVGWDGPHTPFVSWKAFRKWRHPPDAKRLLAAQKKALTESRFFKICRLCRERNNVGCMHDAATCQSCAERVLGVVH